MPADGPDAVSAPDLSDPDLSDPDLSDPDSIITHERSYLARARDDLMLMREDVLGLRALGGDPVSEEYLKAELYRRAEALKDLPDAPLFFGRLFFARQSEHARQGESFHIGRRHVHDPEGRPVVIDWRAPVSRPFYRASQTDPMDLELRRRFGFDGGDLTAFEDEAFGSTTATARFVSKMLVEEIERPRSGPMRDIVATIQPEQDDIVRAGAATTVCVQGAPGTGKTAVGLHRIAYLLYAHKEQVTRRGVVVIGPNRAFLSYIRNVLPALGELDVTQTTITDLVASTPVRGTDTDAVATIKGDARMAEVLRRALWAQLREPESTLVVARGSRRWRVSAYELAELTAELSKRGVRYASGRELLAHRIAHAVLTQMETAGEVTDDRTHDAVRRSAPVRACVDAVWPKVDARRLVFSVLSDPAALKRFGDGLLDRTDREALLWQPAPRGPGSAKWTRADQVLLDEARDLLERTPSMAHVVVDEAQDLSPMEVRAIGRRCSTGAATVLGDLAQGTTPWAATSWQVLLSHLGKEGASVRELRTGYRVPRQILDFASRLLPVIAPGLSPAASLREDAGSLELVPVPLPGVSMTHRPSSMRVDESSTPLGGRVVTAAAEAVRAPGSVAVICADVQVAELEGALRSAGAEFAVLDGDSMTSRLTLVPVTLAKGLEYDHVILVEPARIATGEVYGLRRLYVALTRAVSRLTVIHAEPLPEALRSVK
jgi:DNA helicase IV